MFQLDEKEYKSLKNISLAEETYGGRRYLPMEFTASGVAMLSSVVTSGMCFMKQGLLTLLVSM